MSQIQGLMQDVTIQLVTSLLTVVEVACAKQEQDKKALDQDVEVRIAKLWNLESPIEIVEFYELIAEDAKNLIRKAIPLEYRLKPPDAIHLATADRLKVAEFHTYDEKLFKYSDLTQTKFPIHRPLAKQSTLALPPSNPLEQP